MLGRHVHAKDCGPWSPPVFKGRFSQKQKLNTKSSTEAELVGADDALPSLIWTKNFMEKQGSETSPVLHQDNTSAMLLETNDTESSSKEDKAHQHQALLHQGLH